MSFFDMLENSSNERISQESRPPLMPEGVNVVRIEELVEKQTSNGGKCLHISVRSQSGNWGKIYINTDHSNPKVIEIGVETFKMLLVQVAAELREKFVLTRDFSVLEGGIVDVVCRHEIFNGSPVVRLEICKDAAALAFSKLDGDLLSPGSNVGF